MFDLVAVVVMACQGQIVNPVLMMFLAALMVRIWWGAQRPARIGPAGVDAPGRVRRIPWEQVDAVELPGRDEGSVVVTRAGRRFQTGFPAQYMARIQQIATDATGHRLISQISRP